MDEGERTELRANLGSGKADRVAALMRALASTVPVAGPLIAEVVTEVIPNQRLDRIEAFLLHLADELEERSSTTLLRSPDSGPLVEEGLFQASRAFSAERRRYLAKCVAHGIGMEDTAKFAELKLLQLLGELADDDILLLDAHAGPDWRKFDKLIPPPATLASSDDEYARNLLYKASYRKLEALGLLTFSMSTDEYKMPRYQQDGHLEGNYFISPVGKAILIRVGLLDPSQCGE